MVFAVDASGSIWGPDFKRQLHFIQNIVESFEVSLEGTRVGVLTFGNKPSKQFDLGRYENEADLKAAIGEIKQSRGTTNTADALHRVRTHFFGHNVRDGVMKIVIVITDGRSDDPDATAHQAALARQAGMHIFAIGVGRNVDHDELEAIASRPTGSSIFTVDTFRALHQIKTLLAKRTCEGTILNNIDGYLVHNTVCFCFDMF